jgi:S-methylmethionine-dependent homocysteine/selenocysteine methylase
LTTRLEALLARPEPVLLDGAVGTELSRRGVDTTLPLWSARALLSDSGLDTLARIHEEYARAGAEILVTNTFRTTLRALGRAGAASEWQSANRGAVECARAGAAAGSVAARGSRAAAPGRRAALVAGGLAPLEDCYRPDLVPPQPECLAEHARQAECLAGFGVDLLFIETMNCGREAEAALQAARGTGLDVLLSLCPRPPAHLLSGEPLAEVVPRLVDLGGTRLHGILINCATPEAMDEVYPAFARLASALPHGLYAHLGEPDDVTGWRLPEHHEPEAYASWMTRRLDEGARLVGGCCGTGPGHIEALAGLIAGRAQADPSPPSGPR